MRNTSNGAPKKGGPEASASLASPYTHHWVYGHIAESSSNYTKPKRHHTLRGAVSNAKRAPNLLLKGLNMPTNQSS